MKVKKTPPALLPLDERIEQVRNKIEKPAIREIFDRAVAEIDRDAFATLQDKYRDEVENAVPAAAPKYLDLPNWFYRHARVFRELGLDRSPPRKVLDIGSGGCQFLSICKTYGHDTLGLDLKWPLYYDMAALFGIERAIGPIRHGRPFPKGTGRADIVVIHAQNFDYHQKAKAYWSLEEWASFLEHLTAKHMNMPGRLFIRLNRRDHFNGDADYFWALIELAQAHGAKIGRKPPRMTFDLETPLAFPELESRW